RSRPDSSVTVSSYLVTAPAPPAIYTLSLHDALPISRAAWTGVVATDLGSFTGDGTGRGRRCRLALRLLCLILDPRRCFMLELHALGQLLGLTAQTGFLFRRLLAAPLHVAEDAHGVVRDGVQQLLEQLESLALVLLLGVLLGIAAQVDALTQVVHGRQMLLPQIIQHPQQHLLLEGTQRFRAGQGLLLGVGCAQRLADALAHAILVQGV